MECALAPANLLTMRTLLAVIRLSRLKFLLGGILGVAVGALVAGSQGHAFDLRAYLLAQSIVTAFQLMTHYSNDFFDQESDALALRTPFSGGSGVLVSGELSAMVALRLTLVCAAIGLLACAVAAASGYLAASAIGAAIGALAIAYSLPPVRLLRRGLGELNTALVVGALVPVLAYVFETGSLNVRIVLIALQLACAMFVMMIGVELPDIEADRATGKRNLLVRFGRTSARSLALGAAAASLCVALYAQWFVDGSAPHDILCGWSILGASILPYFAAAETHAGDSRAALTGVCVFVGSLILCIAYYARAPL